MKASKILKRYAAGERNFQRLNLRGQSFKRKDLAGADFSEADIRSTNFTGANLRGANFSNAKCGLQKRWAILLTIPALLLAGISVLVVLVGLVAAAGAVAEGKLVASFVAGVVAGLGVVAIAVAVAIVLAVAGVQIDWRAMRGAKGYVKLRSFAIAFAATGGTNFRGADLSHANFTRAKLKSTDFRKANLTNVRWDGSEMLGRVCSEDT
jgi:hypothetical protein